MTHFVGANRDRLAKLSFNRLLLFCLMLSGMVASLPVKADIAAGLQWLTAQSRTDGSIQADFSLATTTQATSEAVRSFRVFGIHPPAGAAAEQYLTAENYHATEYLARKIIVAAQAGNSTAELASELFTHQDLNDGGFADLPSHQSTVLDTAYALEALNIADGNGIEQIGQAIGFLFQQQRTDGAWSVDGDAPSVWLTALVTRAVWHFRQYFAVSAELDLAQSYLLNARSGPLWEEDFASALALLAIMPRLSSLSPVADALQALEAAQSAHGDWGGDVYTTALALRVLGLADNSVPNTDLGGLRGRLVEASTGLPVAGISVELSGEASATFTTGNDGLFQFTALPVGNYSVVIEQPGYSPLRTLTQVDLGAVIDLGDLLLSGYQTSDTGIVRGVVSDALTGQAIAGANVNVGAVTTQSASDGSYQFTGVAPGSINLSVRYPGYYESTAVGSVGAGSILVFSPRSVV